MKRSALVRLFRRVKCTTLSETPTIARKSLSLFSGCVVLFCLYSIYMYSLSRLYSPAPPSALRAYLPRHLGAGRCSCGALAAIGSNLAGRCTGPPGGAGLPGKL